MQTVSISDDWEVSIGKQARITLLNHYLRETYRKTLSRLDVPEFPDEEYNRVLSEGVLAWKTDSPDNLLESILWITLKGDEEIFQSFLKHRLLRYLDGGLSIPVKDYLAKDLVMNGILQFVHEFHGDEL